VAAVGVVVLAGCSGSEDTQLPEPSETSDSSSSTGTVTALTTTPAPDPDGLAGAWVQMWDGAELLVTDSSAAERQITEVATGAVYEQLDVIYNPTVEGADPSTPRVFDNNPYVTMQPDGTAVVDDCLFETPRAGNQSIWYRGTASMVDGSWRIDSLEVVNQIGCVPRPVADGAIQGYEDYFDAQVAFWDPPDPDHSLLEETTAEPQLSFIRDLLIEHRAEGLALRGRQISHPEIIEVRSAAEVVILDCHELDPEQGLFEMSTGRRVEGVTETEKGDLGLQSAVMLLGEEATWKLSDLQGRDKVDCDLPPTPQGLPVVG
jgi:hypothetical protein